MNARKTYIIFCLLIPFFFISASPLSIHYQKSQRFLTINDIMSIKNIIEVQISPDGSRVLYVITEPDLDKNYYNSDIWMIKADGNSLFKLTNSPYRDERPRWSPDGKRIAFISDRDGRPQIWLIRSDGGEAVQLTKVEGSVGYFRWAPDGSKIAFLAQDPETEEEKRRKEQKGDMIIIGHDLKMTHIYLIEIKTKRCWKLTSGKFTVSSFSWSPDGQYIAFSAQPTPRVPDLFKTDIYRISIVSKKIKKLVERKGADTRPEWSPDGAKIAFVSQDGSQEWITNWYLCLVPAKGGPPRNISKNFDEFITSCHWSSDSKKLYFQANQRVTTQLFSISAETGLIDQITSGESVYSHFSFSKDSGKMAFLATNPATPAEVYVSSVDDFNPSRLTFTNQHLKGLSLGQVEVIHWKSYDGLEIEGLLIKPVGFEAGKKYPLLTYVHGGPSGKFGLSFSPQIGAPYPVQAECYPLQVLAGQGYAIFLPNPRGSYGYGEKFRKANIRDWGHGDYQDIMSGIDYLIKLKIADPDRLGIMGRSYGGYMTSWIITQTDRFKAASLGAGMSNLISFYGQTDIPGYIEYYFGGVPWKLNVEYQRSSPLFYASNIKTPTLIQHGEKDRRVPLVQAWELYRALKKNKVPVEFVIYPRQGHSIREPKFQLDMLNRNLEWFNRWIKRRK